MKRQYRVLRFRANTAQRANTRLCNGFESLENRTLLTTGLTDTGGQIWNQNSTDIAGGSEAGDAFGEAVAVGDFNTDGFDDMAVGVPGESIGSSLNAGAVNVVYGSEDGLSATKNQVWHQDSPGIAGASETGDQLGAALAIYGATSGLTATGNQYWHQQIPGVDVSSDSLPKLSGRGTNNDRFGAALATGDFNGDGADDLAIGVPGDDDDHDASASLVENVGAVNIIYGAWDDPGLDGYDLLS